MIFIPRRAHELPNNKKPSEEVKHNEPLISFRNTFAWILLGEPGAGKTFALKNEAEETGGLFLRIAEFIYNDPEPEWQNKTLFLDGLDEIRSSGKESSTLLTVQKQLKKLRYPPFRITCRAADWYGSTDTEDLKSAALAQEIKILQLASLNENEILDILDAYKIHDRVTFFKKAKEHGIADLLTNPQTLDLLINAIGIDNKWPDTRDEVFKLSCEKLVGEPNKIHRDSERVNPINKNRILDAAGHLSAILLLSGKIGLALDSENSSNHFIQLENCDPPDSEAAFAAIRKKLFRLEEREERVTPYHRNIAEYLASCWLADQIDNKRVPLARILNLLLGSNDRVISGLRGLYGWLALHCKAARKQLIEADSLTVIIYGDAKPMLSENKQHILEKLHEEAKYFTNFLWNTGITHPFGALADPALKNRFKSILQSTDRSDTNQAYVDCVLTILSQGNILDLQDTLYGVIRDDSRWPTVRKSALKIWLRESIPHLALTLLDEITENRITDPDDELAGVLLNKLYPNHIKPENLFKYFYPPKNPNLIAEYAFFWINVLPKQAPVNHLPILIDKIIEQSPVPYYDAIIQHRFTRMANSLLLRGLETHGDMVFDDRLYTWLGIGIDQNCQDQQVITHWLEARPEKYRAVLKICFERCDKQDNVGYCFYKSEQRLRNASPPSQICLWHLNQASISITESLAKLHLSAAVMAFCKQPDTAGLSIEHLRTVGYALNPKGKEWIDELFKCNLPEWQQQMNADNTKRDQKRAKEKESYTSRLIEYLPAVCDGTAPPGIMYELSGVWEKRFLEVNGDTVIDRFKNFYTQGDEALIAAKKGFQLSPFRSDLPSVKEIIHLKNNHKEHLLHASCLIGMELLKK